MRRMLEEHRMERVARVIWQSIRTGGRTRAWAGCVNSDGRRQLAAKTIREARIEDQSTMRRMLEEARVVAVDRIAEDGQAVCGTCRRLC